MKIAATLKSTTLGLASYITSTCVIISVRRAPARWAVASAWRRGAKDGSEFPVEISLTYARGTARGDLVVAAVTDISERLALEREARRAETITSLGTLAAGIAHDLNNPLQVIRSRSELLLESPGTTPASEMNEDLDAIHRQAERAVRSSKDSWNFPANAKRPLHKSISMS